MCISRATKDGKFQKEADPFCENFAHFIFQYLKLYVFTVRCISIFWLFFSVVGTMMGFGVPELAVVLVQVLIDGLIESLKGQQVYSAFVHFLGFTT